MRQIADEKYEYIMNVLGMLRDRLDGILKSYTLDVIEELESLPQQSKQEVQEECKWRYKWQVWNTGCGESFNFDLPQTADALYCPKCRKPITTKQGEG